MRLRSLHEASKAARTATASWIRTELGATKPASIVNVWQCVCVWLMDSHGEICCQLPDYLPSLEIAKAIISIVAVAVAGVARPLEPVGEVAKVVVGHCSRGCTGGGRRRRRRRGRRSGGRPSARHAARDGGGAARRDGTAAAARAAARRGGGKGQAQPRGAGGAHQDTRGGREVEKGETEDDARQERHGRQAGFCAQGGASQAARARGRAQERLGRGQPCVEALRCRH
mmetsp:Transcript_11815/g.25559  ORF Transcript_11815/g.25559 Transcript_11815/m.25559 type:complete len:228 (-) Transcript_11815:510-1193(-)